MVGRLKTQLKTKTTTITTDIGKDALAIKSMPLCSKIKQTSINNMLSNGNDTAQKSSKRLWQPDSIVAQVMTRQML